jgi:hypothetical protein
VNSKGSQIETLRKAKRQLTELVGGCKWFRGVGIAPGEAGLTLRLNVDKTALTPDEEIPHSILGQPIKIVFIKQYSPRATA